MIRFSIAIPAFKTKFLSDCISSILQQSYSAFELIIVNDKSPQPVKSIVDTFEDPRIRYYENDFNIGAYNLVNNWNKCLSYASGDYFVMMGDDDMMEPNYLKEFAMLIERYPDVNVLHCRTLIMDENGRPRMLTPSWPQFESVYDNIWHRINDYRAQYISDFMYKTSYLNGVGGFHFLPLAWGSDDITAYKGAIDHGIAHTNKPVFKYRSNSQTITSSGDGTVKMDAIISYFNWIEEFIDRSNVQISSQDQIIKESLRNSIRKIAQKRKVYTMMMTLLSNGVFKVTYFVRNKQRLKISYSEIAYAFFDFLKRRIAKGKY